ncbi:hypothetical protein D0Y65_011601 [Glycine soja]|uniref:Uncharacterized protein n=1 Tax=Glycine soja TaxID=3848 RepID=A0A445KKW2_GLYSO|nr:hypothetical protein D0Y65_011601 [Glycine soja]
MKNSTDTHRCDIPYSIGGWVYLRLRPYRQSSIATTYNKLSKRTSLLICCWRNVGGTLFWFKLEGNKGITHRDQTDRQNSSTFSMTCRFEL